MAQVANQRAVGLTQRDASARTLIVVCLGHVEGDGAVVVARQHGRAARHFGQKFKHRACAAGRRLQPQAGKAVEQPPLGGFDLHPATHVRRLGQVGHHTGLAARHTQLCEVVDRYRKVARLVVRVVAAHAVQAPAGMSVALPAPAAPQVGTILWRRGQSSHGQHIGQERQRTAAMQALHAVKKNQMTAMVAIEYPHGVELIPRGPEQGE